MGSNQSTAARTMYFWSMHSEPTRRSTIATGFNASAYPAGSYVERTEGSVRLHVLYTHHLLTTS